MWVQKSKKALWVHKRLYLDSKCDCDNSDYLESSKYDSVIMCDEIIELVESEST